MFPLRYLFVATKARRPEMPAIAQVLALVAPVIVGLTTIAQQVAVSISTRDWGQPPRRQLLRGEGRGRRPISSWRSRSCARRRCWRFGFAFVLICLNAMRVGLLTRFMGILGIIVGVLFV